MSHNVDMPRFGPASGSASKITDWGDVDMLDVDALTEYFLEDAGQTLQSFGMTFDFNIDATTKQNAQQLTDSSLVSPENSEDGRLPTIADTVAAAAAATNASAASSLLYTQQPQPLPLPTLPAQPIAPNPLSFNAAFLFPPVGIASIPGIVPNPTLAQFSMAAAAAAAAMPVHAAAAMPASAAAVFDNANKRQRLDVSMLTKQQLAEAAAQAFQKGSGTGAPRKKSQAQIDRRRERNRILARRTRLRKKFFFESLQKEVMDLQEENKKLKTIVATNIEPEDVRNQILESCTAMEKLPESVLEACGERLDEMNSQDFNLVRSIQGSQHCFIITDPCLPDNPIVFASDDFLKLTGYSRDQVLGRNCRFLQGTETSKESVDEIRKGLLAGGDVSVTLVNYTVDGTPFWNKLFIAALRDSQNCIVNYIGVSVRVATPEPGHPEHGKVFEKPEQAESTMKGMDDSVSAVLAASSATPAPPQPQPPTQ